MVLWNHERYKLVHAIDIDYAEQVMSNFNHIQDTDETGDMHKIRENLFDRLNKRNCEVGQLVVLYDRKMNKHVAVMNTQLHWNY